MPMPATAGDYVLVMTAIGDTVREAQSIVYRRLERLEVPNSPMYRTDIGRKLAKQLPVILLGILAQKHIVNGLTAGAVKGVGRR